MGCNGPKEYNVLFQVGKGKIPANWQDMTFTISLDAPCGTSEDDAMEMARQEAEAQLKRHCSSTGKNYQFKEVYHA